jgi:hypothetical protein
MRDRISLDEFSSLMGITEIPWVFAFPFALRTTPGLWNTRDVVSNPKRSADDLRCVAQVARKATSVPFFSHLGAD